MNLIQLAQQSGAVYPTQVASILNAAVRAGGDVEATLEKLKAERPDLFMVVMPRARKQKIHRDWRKHEQERAKGPADRVNKLIERAKQYE